MFSSCFIALTLPVQRVKRLRFDDNAYMMESGTGGGEERREATSHTFS